MNMKLKLFLKMKQHMWRFKGVKFYTMNDGRGTIKQLGEIALGRAFKGLSVENELWNNQKGNGIQIR